MKVLFTVPTLYSNPAHTQACVDGLIETTQDVERDIYVVVNEMNEAFERWKPEAPVQKRCSNLAFNIAKAINTGIDELTDHDYFCFVDEGLRFRQGWLEDLINIYEEYDNVGVIGNKGHSTFKFYHVPLKDKLYEVLWSDGIMLIKRDRIEKVGRFDEDYFADCETQDYCYRLMEAGYTNLYYQSEKLHHKNVGWSDKSPRSKELIEVAERSRGLFMSRWDEWRRARYNR